MKSIIFAGIACCIIAMVGASNLVSNGLKVVSKSKRKCVNDLGAPGYNSPRDIDAQFLAAE